MRMGKLMNMRERQRYRAVPVPKCAPVTLVHQGICSFPLSSSIYSCTRCGCEVPRSLLVFRGGDVVVRELSDEGVFGYPDSRNDIHLTE